MDAGLRRCGQQGWRRHWEVLWWSWRRRWGSLGQWAAPPSPPTLLLTAGCPTVISVIAHPVSGALTFYCLHRHKRSTHAHTRARTETGFPRRLVILTGKLRTHSKQISLFLFNGSLHRLLRKSPNSTHVSESQVIPKLLTGPSLNSL